MQSQTKQSLLITWAVAATVAAMVLAVVAVWLFLLRTQEVAAVQTHIAIETPTPPKPVAPPLVAPPQTPASPGFAKVKESDVPGRYKFSTGGEELGTMTLNADHTFINKDGTIFKQYNWDISEDGLWIQWQRARSRFSIMEKPGVYVAPSPNGKDQRLEKIE